MPDIRRWWPEITNSEIDTLNEYNQYEWIVIKRLINDIGGGKEISRDDLCQSVPSHKIGKLKKAIDSLYKKEFLLLKPKPNTKIYQVDPNKYTDTAIKFAELIRTHSDLFESLISEDVMFIKTSDMITQIIKNTFKNRSNLLHSIRVSEEFSILKDGYGICINIAFNCPHTKNIKVLEFEILTPNDVTEKTQNWSCDCGNTHVCLANGFII